VNRPNEQFDPERNGSIVGPEPESVVNAAVNNPSTIDYSDAAISLRIRQVSQLRKLCLSLGKATPMDE
jgi:hypothetical protein